MSKRGRKPFTREYLISRLQEAAKSFPPITERKMRSLKGFPGSRVFSSHFGSWKKAMIAAGLPPNIGGLPKKEALDKDFANLRMRFAVFHRDSFTCQYCGRSPQNGAKLVVDHVVPVKNGGLTSIDNLITSCFECNSGKSDLILSNRPK